MSEAKCPNCGKVYEPELKDYDPTGPLIQKQFPNATPIQREQLITGICSNKCWDEYLGPEELGPYDDGDL